MKTHLIGTIVAKATGNWVANLYVREQEYGGQYIAIRHVQGFQRIEWSGANIQYVLDSVEGWLGFGELVVRPLDKPVKI